MGHVYSETPCILYVLIVLFSYFMINKARLFIKIKLYEIMPKTNNP